MMDVRVMDGASVRALRLKNEPFELFGRMVPALRDGRWSHEVRLFPEGERSVMCFPDDDDVTEEDVLVGAFDGPVCVGLAVLREGFFRYMELHDLKVARAFRRRGVGRALIDKARECAVSRGYRGLYAIAQDNNLGACLFYLRAGFQIGGFDNRVYDGTSQAGKADILFYLDA